MSIAFLYTLNANLQLFSPYIEKYLNSRETTVSYHANDGQLIRTSPEQGAHNA